MSTPLELARAAFPDVSIDEGAFMKALELTKPDPERWGDLFLAHACLRGDPAAVGHFERLIIARLDPVLARIDARPEAMDEARQRVRERLLVATPGRAPRLADYRGEAPLWRWVKTVAVRLLVDVAREETKAVHDDEAIAAALVTSGRLDLDFVQRAHRADVTRAFEAALGTLEPRERNVLRLAHVEGQSIDRIAALYGTHRATAARWLVAARERLVAETRSRLRAALGLGQPELESLLAALDGHLERSLRHFFDEPEPP